MIRMSDDQPEDQRIVQTWETPTHAEIVELTRAHVAGMEVSDDDMVWVPAGMHHVLLHTIGRRSGNEHKVALPYWKDPDGHRIVVGSFAGAEKDPAWVLNLRDRDANPRVKVRVQGGLFWSDHQILEGADHADIWERLCADRAFYAHYQTLTERLIPLIRLVEIEAITG